MVSLLSGAAHGTLPRVKAEARRQASRDWSDATGCRQCGTGAVDEVLEAVEPAANVGLLGLSIASEVLAFEVVTLPREVGVRGLEGRDGRDHGHNGLVVLRQDGGVVRSDDHGRLLRVMLGRLPAAVSGNA
ncbi:MAG: hypothetical protein EBR82_87775, partial [Caulobacteraceae bacterium]|nr:hypothetical protein [Caulobacteraceae bacterium]